MVPGDVDFTAAGRRDPVDEQVGAVGGGRRDQQRGLVLFEADLPRRGGWRKFVDAHLRAGFARLWRDGGYAVGALMAGLLADALGIPTTMAVIGGLTFLSGVIVAGVMYETLPARRTAPISGDTAAQKIDPLLRNEPAREK